MKLQLIDNWRDAWRMSSNVASAALGLLTLVQADVLPFLQPLFAPGTFTKVVAAFAVLIVFCRVTAAEALKLQLVENWRDAWLMSSNWASSALGLLTLVQADVLPHLQPMFSATAWPKVVAGFAVLIVVCRITSQPSLHPAPGTVAPAPAQGGA